MALSRADPPEDDPLSPSFGVPTPDAVGSSAQAESFPDPTAAFRPEWVGQSEVHSHGDRNKILEQIYSELLEFVVRRKYRKQDALDLIHDTILSLMKWNKDPATLPVGARSILSHR